MNPQPMNEETARAFIDGVIYPTLTRAEELVKEGLILAGGPVAGRIALRFMVEIESAEKLDELVTTFPLWAVAETRVTPLIEFSDRHDHVQALMQRMFNQPA